MLGFIGCGWVRIGCSARGVESEPADARRCNRTLWATAAGWPQSVASLAIAASIIIGGPQQISVQSAVAMGVPVQSPAMDPKNSRAMEDYDFKLNKSLFEEAWGAVFTTFYDVTAGKNFSREDWREERERVLDNKAVVFSSRERTYDAIRDIVAAIGDPYTRFLTPEEYRAEYESRSASALTNAGVGLQVRLDFLITSIRDASEKNSRARRAVRCTAGPPPDPLSPPPRLVPPFTRLREQIWDPFDGVEDLQVLAPLPESPAEQAGIVPGDHLKAIDGIDVEYSRMTPDEAIAILRGADGAPVSLLMRSPDREEDDVVVLKRRPLLMKPIKSEILHTATGDVGYIRIHMFLKTARDATIFELQRMVDSGVTAIVVDVRNCLGGVFQEALATASLFLDNENYVLVKTLDGNGIEEEHTVEAQSCMIPAGVAPTTPLAVLVNAGSASSSEVLAVALRENGRATLVGEPTFGKGLIQHTFVLPDRSAVVLTVAEYITPRHHRHIQNQGTRPDLLCRSSPTLHAGEDPCVSRAVAELMRNAVAGELRGRPL